MPVAVAVVATRTVALMGRSSDKRTKMLLRAARPAPPPSARAPTRGVTVAHPRVPGATERVQRVFDTVEHLHRNKLFGKDSAQARRRYEAALIFRSAWDMLVSSIGGVMDFDRVRGGSPSGSPPAPPYLRAANLMRQARQRLYPMDHRVLQLVVGRGHMIAEVASMVHGQGCSRGSIEQIGFRLREGLDRCADMWIGRENDAAALRTWRPAESVPQAEAAGESVERGAVAHASGKGVRMSGGD